MKTHLIRRILCSGLFLVLPQLADAQVTGLDITEYDLSLRLDLEQHGPSAPLNTLSATAEITFINRNESPVTRVPVILYRLLQVEAVRNYQAEPLGFTQRLGRLENWERYQANVVTIDLDRPLPAGSQTTIEIDYTGQVVGIRESGMLYVQDSLDPDFTIIRAESAIYPHLAEPTMDSLQYRFGRGGDVFDQIISITVPDDVVVASGLVLSDRQSKDGFSTWQYHSRDPNTQIILPMAPYEVIEMAAVRIFFFSEDKEGAQRVAKGIGDAMMLFEDWFGDLAEDSSFAVVEIPEWYGSQALRPTVILDARAFRSPKSMPELYHEISHFWNVRDPALAASRWEEGLAMYLQEIVQRELDEDAEDLGSTWSSAFRGLKRQLDEHPEYRDVPLIQAGERNLTSVLSYRGGQLMFALLDRRLGRERLLEVLGAFYQAYVISGATSEQFAEFVVSQAPGASRIIEEWFFGSAYSELVLAEPDFDALVLRYQVN
ncbi:MAG TPA: hypothetical protein VLA11_04015 [Woeseiaceae bacterium]|jgi:hypothetical protein|nr:hypothetical protein [Woeseiaceae bacterium]